MSGSDSGTEPSYRYRVVGSRGNDATTPVVWDDFAYDLADARSKAAFHRRWGYDAWVEQQQIIEPPAWERA